MAVTISVIFVLCWAPHSILHTLADVGSYKLNPFAIPISHTMLMFNSAVNPFAYALLSHRFREKINGMLCCCPGFRATRIPPERAPQYIEMANNTTKHVMEFKFPFCYDHGLHGYRLSSRIGEEHQITNNTSFYSLRNL